MWVVALVLFLAGSVVSGLAWSAGSLIAFRVLQGLGGGMILPLNQVVMARAAGPERLGRVMGVVGLVGQLAPISGPLLGGVLIDTWGWRWVFFVNVPIVATSLAMTAWSFPRDEERTDRPLDVTGAMVLPAAVIALLYGLSTLQSAALRTDTILAGATGVLLLAVFVMRGLRRGAASLIDLRLFTNFTFRAGAVMMFLLGVTTWGPMFLLPLYYQQLRGLSAFDAGIMLAPQSIGTGLAFLLVGRYADRMSPRPLAALGMAIAAAGTVPFAFATAHTDAYVLAVALLVRGVGAGIGSLPIAVAVYRTLPAADIPGATSASNVIQRIGAAAGTAFMAVILQANGFTSALTWMLVLTVAGMAGTALLPGRDRRTAPPGRSPRDRRTTAASNARP